MNLQLRTTSALSLPEPLLAGPAVSLPVPEHLQVIDLLGDFDQLCRLLLAQLERKSWLDCFLLAAGLNQLLEDHLHRDVRSLNKVADTVAHLSEPSGLVSRRIVLKARSVGLAIRDRNPQERRLRAWQTRLAELVNDLAGTVAADGPKSRSGLERRAAELLNSVEGFPKRLRSRVIQLPTCFRSLDQRPEDCEQLVTEFAKRWPDRGRPLLVVGLRTSGSYLAPLYGAYLKTSGYQSVFVMTVRPGQDYLPSERAHLSSFDSRGLVLLADDPPKSGKSLALAAISLEALGITTSRIVMLLPLMAPATEAPSALRDYASVTLPWERWAIHWRLQPQELRPVLNRLLMGRTVRLSPPNTDGTSEVTVREVLEVDRVGLSPIRDLKSGSPVRRHIRDLLRVTLRDGQGRIHLHHIYVKGAGLGYFGAHSAAVAEPVANFIPEGYGLEGGLLFRSWMPDEARVRAPASDRLADRIATYVAARHRELAVPTDTSERLLGLNPLWQRAADLIGLGFGRGRPLARPLLHSAARRLLRVRHPSVIDGSMAISQWFSTGADSETNFLKVDYDERAYSNQDTVIDQLYCYDAAYDLASAAADQLISSPTTSVAKFEDRLLQVFQEAVGESLSSERWLIYQLIYVKSYLRFLESTQREASEGIFGRPGEGGFDGIEPDWLADELDHLQRTLSRLDQAYLARQMFADVDQPAGPICGIDIDGVLETAKLGFSSAGPQGALTLRALSRHGYRPVLVTGRCLDEVRDRCAAYRLAGGVAEYGAVAYDHATGQVHELLSATQRDHMARLRQAFKSRPEIHVASAYRHAIRAYAIDSDGGRAPLRSETVESILASTELTGQVRLIPGYQQTDFMVAGVDKGTGLRSLVEMISAPGKNLPLAVAVGDSESDLPMFALSSKAFAPSNADAAVKAAGITLMRRPYQGGLTEAARRVLGHRPGSCPTCRWRPAGDTALLFSVLRAQENGFLSKLRSGMELALRSVQR